MNWSKSPSPPHHACIMPLWSSLKKYYLVGNLDVRVFRIGVKLQNGLDIIGLHCTFTQWLRYARFTPNVCVIVTPNLKRILNTQMCTPGLPPWYVHLRFEILCCHPVTMFGAPKFRVRQRPSINRVHVRLSFGRGLAVCHLVREMGCPHPRRFQAADGRWVQLPRNHETAVYGKHNAVYVHGQQEFGG